VLGEMTNTDMGTDDTGPYVMEAEWWNKQGLGEVGGGQGLTLVHFSAQLKRILSDKGAFRDCLEVV
jgi:hypothetical protein